jgi:hypothetical protein
MVPEVLAKSLGVSARLGCALIVLAVATQGSGRARADDSATVLEFRYTPVARAQVAIWVEDAAGGYLATVALTEAVAYRGIGNRPGASQMNSGYRWPYGRRESVLPIWAHRRASAPGAKLFPRVIFQSRAEGSGTRSTNDQSADAYYCLQFDPTLSSRDRLDAISCASPFSSDKGRYLTRDDVSRNYAEPWQDIGRDTGLMQPLPLDSVYPSRMDAARCTADNCYDHADVARFTTDVRAVMPDIDAVTRATAPGDTAQKLLFSVPAAWGAGDYVAWIEVNVEGDYNDHWNATSYPTPQLPDKAWDLYATSYGYPYRGQPSIVYKLPFSLGGAAEPTFAVDAPAGRSSWDHWRSDFGQLEPVSVSSADADGFSDSDGSGADRLRRDASGTRFAVQIKRADALGSTTGSDAGSGNPTQTEPPGSSSSVDAGAALGPAPPGAGSVQGPVGPIRALSVRRHDNELRAHTWIVMRFQVPRSERAIHDYDVRVATDPIVDEASFIRDGRPAKSATDDPEGATGLMLPAATQEGQIIETAIGDLVAETHYYVAVRATDDLNRHGPISVAEITTAVRKFATVTPCFIASAAYGSALASEVSVLRHVRDRYLMSVAPGRALVDAYYTLGPRAAGVIEHRAPLRAAVRWLLLPLVALAKTLP